MPIVSEIFQIARIMRLSNQARFGGIKIVHAVETKSRYERFSHSLYFPWRCLCLGFFELERSNYISKLIILHYFDS